MEVGGKDSPFPTLLPLPLSIQYCVSAFDKRQSNHGCARGYAWYKLILPLPTLLALALPSALLPINMSEKRICRCSSLYVILTIAKSIVTAKERVHGISERLQNVVILRRVLWRKLRDGESDGREREA